MAESSGKQSSGQGTTLRDVTRDWFLLLTTLRRKAPTMPGEAEPVRVVLEKELAEMERRASSDPALLARYKVALYPLVYLADEILLTCHWQGESKWARDLLETRLFGTLHAGQDFFERLDAALAGDDLELTEVFHRCLALGFRGRMIKQRAELAETQRGAFRLVPSESVTDGKLHAEAYGATDERAFTPLPKAMSTGKALLVPLLIVLVWGALAVRAGFAGSELGAAAEEYLVAAPVVPGE